MATGTRVNFWFAVYDLQGNSIKDGSVIISIDNGAAKLYKEANNVIMDEVENGVALPATGVFGFWSTKQSHTVTIFDATGSSPNMQFTITPNIHKLVWSGGLSDSLRTFDITIDVSEDVEGASLPLITIKEGGVIHNVIAHIIEALDGGITKTFEVGEGANEDNYIDTTDLGYAKDSIKSMIGGSNNDQKIIELVKADTTIEAFWTNHGTGAGAATAGKVRVIVYYTGPAEIPAEDDDNGE